MIMNRGVRPPNEGPGIEFRPIFLTLNNSKFATRLNKKLFCSVAKVQP